MKVHYCACEGQPLIAALNKINPICALPSYLAKIPFFLLSVVSFAEGSFEVYDNAIY
jgi:hypothetical protein